MKKNIAIFIVATISIILSSNSFAGICLHEKLPIKNKLLFTAEGSYVASFISGLKSDNLYYPGLNLALAKHFSQESGREVEGKIWENVEENENEFVLIVRNSKHRQIADLGISVKFFTKDGEFAYRVGELQHILKQYLGEGIYFEGFRTTKPSVLINFIHKDDDFIVFKP